MPVVVPIRSGNARHKSRRVVHNFSKTAPPGHRQKATSGEKGPQKAKMARVAPKGKRSQGSSCRAMDSCAIFNWSSLSMYFSYVPSIIFSFFNRPLFLNLLFKQILIQTDPNSILFIRVLRRSARSASRRTVNWWPTCRARPSPGTRRKRY